MLTLIHNFGLTAPLFLILMAGYVLVRWGGWSPASTRVLSRFVFTVALPAMLFRLMSQAGSLQVSNWRLLAAFFGSCLLVYGIGRILAVFAFRLDGESQSIFALSGVYSNLVLLGLPMARAMLGEDAVAAVSCIIVFNALILWTLATVSIEWSRQQTFSIASLRDCLKRIARNPIIVAILLGSLFGFSGLELPVLIDRPLLMIGEAASPLALVVLGMSLASYGVRQHLRLSVAMTVMKLGVHPLVAVLMVRALGLSQVQSEAVVLVAAVSLAANVYLISETFNKFQAPVASCMVLSTLLAPFTVPIALALLK